LARQWAVRARSFDAFLDRVISPLEHAAAPQPLHVLDLGAGNGWLCYRLTLRGHRAVALDWRSDEVDGLGAGAGYDQHVTAPIPRVAASFDAIPLLGAFDVVVFNAAIHYSTALPHTLREAIRVTRSGGRVVVLDSPFYRHAADGERMVAQKHVTARREWGARAADLLALPAIEFLTVTRLTEASAPLGMSWRRHRVRYPLWYELRPLVARLRGRRTPSRFDVWEGTVP
jgi:SAM-dependent methyltransferase